MAFGSFELSFVPDLDSIAIDEPSFDDSRISWDPLDRDVDWLRDSVLGLRVGMYSRDLVA